MTVDAPTERPRPEFGAQFKFHEVVKAEIALINGDVCLSPVIQSS